MEAKANIDHSFLDKILRKSEEIEEDVLRGVLREVLNREPTNEDAKDLCRTFRQCEHMNYELSWRNIPLGSVVRGLDSVKFIPLNKK